MALIAGLPHILSVLKELIQNADDAGAKVVRLCFDQRKHDQDGLLYPGLAGFQGPALYCFNDSVFSDEDFRSITRIGDSSKQAMKSKVGRFGVGFNSVYHLTDVPSFCSGQVIGHVSL